MISDRFGTEVDLMLLVETGLPPLTLGPAFLLLDLVSSEWFSKPVSWHIDRTSAHMFS